MQKKTILYNLITKQTFTNVKLHHKSEIQNLRVDHIAWTTVGHPKICHFDTRIILSWSQKGISRWIKDLSQSSPYLTKIRNFWDKRTAINPFSHSRFMAVKKKRKAGAMGTKINLHYQSLLQGLVVQSLFLSLLLLEAKKPFVLILSTNILFFVEML